MELATGQRSKKGCLTCRQKRKKCDEVKPICGRCGCGDECIWPLPQPIPKATPRRRAPNIKLRTLLDPILTDEPASSIEPIPTSAPGANKPTSNSCPHELDIGSLHLFPELATEGSSHAFIPYSFTEFTPAVSNPSDWMLGLGTLTPGSAGAQIHPSRLIYEPVLPALNTLALTRIDEDELDLALDEDEEETLKATVWLPGILQSLSLYLSRGLSNQEQVQWSSVIDSYFTFFARYCYDPSTLPAHMCDVVVRHYQIESVRLAALSASFLFYSFLNPALPRAPLRGRANEFINAATVALRFEESHPSTTLEAQLAGISGILGFYYYIGDVGSYIRWIEKALPIVRKLVGTTPVSIHKLYGPETLDIRLFAWCDVFSAIATSRPTRLVYDCDAEMLLKRNQEGPDLSLSYGGLEWMSGLPDAFLLLIMRVLNLKHGSASVVERTAQATVIEAALRGWKVWPSDTPSSVMRIQRVSAQEIWRHFAILYLYQTIHRATPGQEVVQQSVKQIIKLASTLRPGHNPDCLLYVPYFIAGTFAVSAKERQFIRHRLMRCGIDTYTKTLVHALEVLWGGSPVDTHIDWTSRTPPLVIL